MKNRIPPAFLDSTGLLKGPEDQVERAREHVPYGREGL